MFHAPSHRDNYVFPDLDRKIKKLSNSIAENKADNLKKMRFFTEYNPRAPKVFNIIKKHEHFIRGHEFLKNVFPLVASK